MQPPPWNSRPFIKDLLFSYRNHGIGGEDHGIQPKKQKALPQGGPRHHGVVGSLCEWQYVPQRCSDLGLPVPRVDRESCSLQTRGRLEPVLLQLTETAVWQPTHIGFQGFAARTSICSELCKRLTRWWISVGRAAPRLQSQREAWSIYVKKDGI